MSNNVIKVYLCTQKPSSWSYECKMFNNFLEADDYYNKKYINTQPKATMIPVCKYIPYFLRPFILNYKLSTMTKINLNV